MIPLSGCKLGYGRVLIVWTTTMDESCRFEPPLVTPFCPCVVHTIVGLIIFGFSLVGGNLKLNVLDVDTCLGACSSRRFILQEKCHVARSNRFYVLLVPWYVTYK